MGPRVGINELPSNPDATACLSDAAFEDIAHPQLAADLFHIYGATLVGKAGIPRDDEETAKRDRAVIISSTTPSAKYS